MNRVQNILVAAKSSWHFQWRILPDVVRSKAKWIHPSFLPFLSCRKYLITSHPTKDTNCSVSSCDTDEPKTFWGFRGICFAFWGISFLWLSFFFTFQLSPERVGATERWIGGKISFLVNVMLKLWRTLSDILGRLSGNSLHRLIVIYSVGRKLIEYSHDNY